MIPNWSFTVTDSSGASSSLVTLQGGRICAGFPVGAYTITEILKPGWAATTPTTQTISVSTNQATDVSFGNREGGSAKPGLPKTR